MDTPTTEISGSLDLRNLDPARRIADQLVTERGEPPDWLPTPHRENLACAIIDAVMTPRISTAEVDRVVERYREKFPDAVTSSDLAQTFSNFSLQRWRDEVGTRHRVYASLDAPYKVDVIAQAANLLASYGVQTRSDLKTRAEDADLRSAWCAMPGQHSGSSWRHLLLISGFDRSVVCLLTRRFIRRSLKGSDLQLEDGEILASMSDVAGLLDVTPAQVDHQMWRAGAGAPRKAISARE